MVDLTIEKVDPKDGNRLAIVKYLKDRTFADTNLDEACQKEKKTIDGVMSYIKGEAQKQAVNGMAMVADDVVYGWAVHYILEDSIDCEPKKAEKKTKTEAKPAEPFDFEKWRKEHPIPTAPIKPIETSGQLTFDF